MTKLHISTDFSLPLDVAGEAIGILATRGAGKSFTSAVLVEELFDAGVQTVVLDPTGVYWGLRGSGREKKGLPIYVFGGNHGDLPLEPTAGVLLADLAVDENNSFVIDLSGFDTKGEQTRFVRSFAERLYRRKAQKRDTLHLVVDEADEFAPQRPLGKDEPFMLGAMEAIVRRGRSRGLGVTLITQRSAALNKNVLDLVETLIVMRTLGPRDRKAIEGWISHHELADELGVLDSLPGLRTGKAWVWSPVRDILQSVDVRKIRTFDSYRTPKPGETQPQPREMAPIDLEDLGQRMAATVERAKAADPRELRKRIEQLERELRTRPVEQTIKEVAIEVPVVSDTVISELETMVAQLRDAATAIVDPIIDKTNEILHALSERHRLDQRAVRQVTTGQASASTHPAPEFDANGFAPTNPQQRVLDAIAWLEAMGLEADRLRVGFLAGYRQSGNFSNLISGLNTAGAVVYPRAGAVALTELGQQLADHPEAALTTSEVQERVMAILTKPQQRVLQAILDVYDDDISREDLAAKTDYAHTSGNFNNLVSGLTSLGLISRSRPGYVRAEDVMFVT
jgi:hypothetical protein